jgi:argininosuccinate lyase
MEMSHNTDYSLWGGRFELPSDELMKKFNESFSVDKRLWKQDIAVRYFVIN